MKARSVTYTATINLSQYNNEKIEILVEIDDAETVAEAIKWCRQHVEENTFAP